MNYQAPIVSQATTTRAADGFDRRAFTSAEILAMQDAGIIGPEENFELIEGDIVPTNAKMHMHERIKLKLILGLAKACPEHLTLGVETSLFLGDRTILEPDLSLFSQDILTHEVKGTDLILAIEVAATTLRYDMGLKPKIYARYGVRELWVIDAAQRRTFIHRGPQGDQWAGMTEHPPEFELTIPELPGFRQRLSDL